jgi:hypothetical protein
MVGDILLHDPVEKYARQEDGTYQFDAIFEKVKEEISEADVAIVNQEVIIGGESFGVVYGRTPLMVTEKCVGREISDCDSCRGGRL